jgi:hypothetical protein
LRAQGVIEFLTTWSWAIVVIGVVAAALFGFGVFNVSFFTPRAQPGSCQVYRPDGPGSGQFLSFVGVCDGELPEFTSDFGYSGGFSEFGYSNITVPVVKYEPKITNTNGQKITITAWMISGPQGNSQTAVFYGNPAGVSGEPPFNGIYLNTNESGYCNSGMVLILYTGSSCMYGKSIPINSWFFVAMEYNGTNAIGYSIISGNEIITKSPVSYSFYIPAHSKLIVGTPWNGLISNVQLYNTSLSANQVYATYLTGIGGAPIYTKYLAGWWPLNDNLNDYSGNNNNGYAANAAYYSGTWEGGYVAPP